MSIQMFHFHFGPDNAFFCSGPGGWIHQGLSETEVRRLQLVLPTFPQTSRGVGGSYATVAASGEIYHQLNGKYPFLEDELKARAVPVELIALNPFVAGSFVIIYKNGGGYLCHLPLSYQSRVVEFIRAGMLPILQATQRRQTLTNPTLANLTINGY